MRAVVVSSLLVLLACGGSKKPAESASESPSTESSASSSSETPPSDSAASAASAAPASSAAPAESAASEAAPAPSSGSSGPNVTGAIDGKPFVPKMARITHPMQKDGRILLTLDEHLECGGGEANQGEGIMTMMVTWEDGYKVDLGSLKRGGKKGGGEISFVRVGAHGKKDPSATFKPTGKITVVKAPMEQNGVGKVNIDLQSGEYMLSGDLDVQACVAPKSAHAQTAAKKKK